VHGARWLKAGGDPKATLAEEADALIADPGTSHAVAIRVADCVPVLLADPKTGRVAAIHAGWRGIEAGVIGATLEAMTAASASDLIAAIGPCIGPCCFEVGKDVAARIARVSSPDVITREAETEAGEKSFVDLRRAARTQLRALGVTSVDDVPSRDRDGCTRCNAREFYSYRRDGDNSGRLIAVIVAR